MASSSAGDTPQEPNAQANSLFLPADLVSDEDNSGLDLDNIFKGGKARLHPYPNFEVPDEYKDQLPQRMLEAAYDDLFTVNSASHDFTVGIALRAEGGAIRDGVDVSLDLGR